MLEIFLLLALVLFLPALGAGPWVMLAAFCAWGLVSLPGAWMLFRGAPPLVPTSSGTIRTMLDLADVRPGDRVYDVGCGDGRIVFAAAARGADATGYELSVPAFLLAWVRSLFHARSRIRYANFWKKDFADADVVCCYLLIGAMADFKEVVWPRLKPGTRVVSHSFTLPGVKASAQREGVYLYVR